MPFENTSLSLAEVHNEVMPIIIPIVIVIAILMFVGVIGNAAVIYIYSFVLKNTTVHYFITVLAVFDFICCLLGFPLEIVEFYNTIEYPSNGLCKWQRFLTFCCSIGSIFILLLISIERHRKVCRPQSYQLNLMHAKYFTVGACFFSVLLATPMTFFSQNKLIRLKWLGNLTGCDCRLSTSYGILPLIYFIFLFVFATVTLATMLILYGLLWQMARTHFLESDSRYQQSLSNTEAGGRSPARRQLSRTNHTVILVTVLFTVSFFPTLLLSIFADQLMANMSYREQLIFFMFVRMYILNSSFNPLVYGFCNKRFRSAFVKLFWQILCRSPKDIQSPSTETS